MKIPNNWRQLKSGEIIRKGDKWESKINTNFTGDVEKSIGDNCDEWDGWAIWRRRHTKAKPVMASVSPRLVRPQFTAKKPVVTRLTSGADVTEQQAKNVAVVDFHYHGKMRTVQLISFDPKYLIGLEITLNWDNKRKYQFKRFLTSEIWGTIKLIHYGAPWKN